MFKKVISLLLLISIIIFLQTSVSGKLLSQEAMKYYKQAKGAMQKNDLDTAMEFFQKTIALRPYYVEAYNDLGVLYEKRANISKAREYYKKAISIQPDYAPAYMNLAMLEESIGNIDNAVFYWKARIAFGKTSDVWSKRARNKLKKYAPEEAKKGVKSIMEEVLNKLQLEQEQKDQLALKHLSYGKQYFREGKYSKALDEFRIAYELSPGNVEIQRFISKTTVSIMQEYFSKGVKYFRQNDYESARYNFQKIIKTLPGQE